MITAKRIIDSLAARWFAGAIVAALLTGSLEKLLWCVTPFESNLQLSNISMVLGAELAFLTVSLFVLVFAVLRKNLASSAKTTVVLQTIVITVTGFLYLLSVPVTEGAPESEIGAYIARVVIIGIVELAAASFIAQVFFLNKLRKVNQADAR